MRIFVLLALLLQDPAPPDTAALRAEATQHLEAGRSDQALSAATRLLGVADEPDHRLLLARASLAEANRIEVEGTIGRGSYLASLLLDAEASSRDCAERAADPELRREALLFLAYVQNRRGDREGARDSVDRILAEHEADVDALAMRGYLDLTGDEPLSSLPDLERAIELAPDRSDLRLYRVRALRARSTAEAAAALTEMIDAELTDTSSGWHVYQLIGFEPPLAVEVLARLVDARDADAGAWFHYGRALIDADRASDALAAFDRAAELAPDDPSLLPYRADARRRSDDLDGYVDDLIAAARADVTESEWVIGQLASTAAWLAEQGDWDGVRRITEVLVELQPEEPFSHGNLALALMRLNRVDDAEATFRVAIELFPDDERFVNDYGILLEGVGRKSDASLQYRHAAALGSLDGLENLAILQLDLGERAAAAEGFARVLAEEPGRSRSLLGYARATDRASRPR